MRPARRSREPDEPLQPVHLTSARSACAPRDPSRGSSWIRRACRAAARRPRAAGSRQTAGGSRSRIAAIRLAWLAALERAAARRHLVEHRAERDRCRCARPPPALRAARAPCTGRAEDHALHGQRSRCVGGASSDAAGARARAGELRQAEVEQLGAAPSSSMTLPGFRSRWMMPLPVRAVERVGDLDADTQRLVERQRAALQPLRPASRLRGTPSRGSRRRPARPTSYSVQMCGWLRLAIGLRFALEALRATRARRGQVGRAAP